MVTFSSVLKSQRQAFPCESESMWQVLGQPGLHSDTLLLWAGKVAQEMKVLTAKLDSLSLIYGTHIVEGENPLIAF